MKKISFLLIFSLITALLLPISSSAENEIAENITSECEISITAGDPDIYRIHDGSTYSLFVFDSDDTLSISSEKSIGGIYIKWDRLPEKSGKISADGKTLDYGKKGFLHEYIAVGGAKSAEISVYKDMRIAEMEIYSEGSLPPEVEVWNEPYERADLLLFPTHADDEHLFFGGIMPIYAGEKKLRVQVVYMTYHLPYRTHELLAGLWAVGITAYPVISPFEDIYADSLEMAESIFDKDKFCEFQVEQIRRFKPYVIVAHDLNGEYGHGVHMLNAHTMCDACSFASDPEKYPSSAEKYGVWDVPKTYLHLYPENKITLDYSVPLSAFGGKTALEVCAIGWSKHKSQQSYFVLKDYGPNDCRLFGLFRSTVGEDIQKNDIFENIVFENEEEETPKEPSSSESEPASSEPSSEPEPAENSNRLYIYIAASAALIIIIVFIAIKSGGKRKPKRK